MKRKGKRWLLLAALTCVTAFSALGASCTDDSSSSTSSTGSGTGNENTPPAIETVVSVTLDAETLTMEKFSTKTLQVNVVNVEGTPVWSTSDESVVSVQNGKIIAKKTGTATVSVAVGGYTDSCVVTVKESEGDLEFSEIDDTVYLVKGTSYEFDGYLSYGGHEFPYAEVSFALENGNAMTMQGNKITANAYGTQKVTVTATYSDEVVLTKEVAVVCEEYGSIQTDLYNNNLSLFATDYLGSAKEYNLTALKPQIDGVTTSAALTFEVENENVVKVDGNKLVAVKPGKTTVTASFSSTASGTERTYDTIINVTVNKELLVKDVDFFVKGSGANTGIETGTATVDLAGTGISVNDLTAVKIGGESCTFTKDGDKIKLTNAPAGEQIYTLETELLDYQIEGCIYQLAISSAAELNAFMRSGNNKGYVVLNADMDFGGAELVNYAGWFDGTFDGRGHTLSNFETKYGLFQNTKEYKTTVIKNLQLINVTKSYATIKDKDGNNIARAAGILGYQTQATYENILIVGKIEGGADKQAILTGCEYETTVMKNIVAKVQTDSALTTGTGGYYTQGMGGVISDVYYVVEGEFQIASPNANYNTAKRYETVGKLLANTNVSNLADYGWTVSSDRLPYMREYSSVQENFVVEARGDCKPNAEVEIFTTLADAQYAIVGTAAGVTIKDNIVSVGLFEGTFTVQVSSKSNVNLKKTIVLNSVDATAFTFTKVEYEDEFVAKNNGAIEVDMSKITTSGALAADDLQFVLINGAAKMFTVEGEIVKITVDGISKGAVGEGVVISFVGKKTGDTQLAQEFVATVADYVISDWATFKAYMQEHRATAMYAAVSADISRPALTTWGDSNYAVSADNTIQAANSVLNGYGHKISFVYSANGWFSGKTQSNSTIKNLVIDGLYFHNSGALGSVLHNITLENVDIKVVIPDTSRGFWGSGYKGLLAARARNLQLINCNIVFDIPAAYADKELRLTCFGDVDTQTDAYYYITMTNTTIVSNGKIAYNGEKDTHFNWTTHASEITLDNTSKIIEATLQDVNTQYVALTNGGKTLDLSVFGSIGTVEKVYVSAGTKHTYTLNGNVATFTENIAGERGITIKTNTGYYSFTCAFADTVISSKDAFATWYSSATRGMYTVITTDIDWANDGSTSNFRWMGAAPLANSTLNGLGHTLSNVCFDYGFWATKDVNNVTMKNLKLNNLYFKNYSAFGTKNCDNSTFENITMTAIFHTNYTQDGASSLLPQWMRGTKFNNCNFTFKANDSLKTKVLPISVGSGKSFILNNTTIHYDGFVSLNGEREPISIGTQYSGTITYNGTSAINDQRTVVTAKTDGSVTLNLATLGLTGKTVSSVSTGTLVTQTGDSVVITGLAANKTTLVTLTLNDTTTKLVWLQVKAAS